VAKAVGVSISTVSYALSGKRPVSEEKRQKIIEQINRLNYKPNAVARNLAQGETHTIGLYCSKSSNGEVFFLYMLNGIMDTLRTMDYSVLLINTIVESDDFVIPIDKTFPVDGFIVTNARNSCVYLTKLQQERKPFILVGKPPKGIKANFVDNNNVTAAYKAVEYVFKKGAKRVALITEIPKNYTANLDYMTGYMLAYSDYQIPYDSNLIIHLDKNNMKDPGEIISLLKKLNVEGIIVTAGVFTFLIGSLLKDTDLFQRLILVVFYFDTIKEHYSNLGKEIVYFESNAYALGASAASSLLKIINGEVDGMIETLYLSEMKII
jgi:Transcriptional regulators